ncbi:MAG: hypothetical protein PSX37_04985 [bacterium]|nr:hypothetical protein [bacterium]
MATPVPSSRATGWASDLSTAGVAIVSAERGRDVEGLEGAVRDGQRRLDALAKESKATRASAANAARALQSRVAHGAVLSYLLRTKDCRQNSIARMAGIAKNVREGRTALVAWIDASDRKWLTQSLATLNTELAACLHLTLTFDSFMQLNDPKWEVAGQFEVPLAFRMDPDGKPYWAGKQTGIVENVTLSNADGCTWTVDPTPFSFEVARLELAFSGVFGTINDVNLKEYSTDVPVLDIATGICPDKSPPPVPIWGWSLIFADMRGYLSAAVWPELRNWQTATTGGNAEMYKVLKGTTSSSGFTESSTLFLYRR